MDREAGLKMFLSVSMLLVTADLCCWSSAHPLSVAAQEKQKLPATSTAGQGRQDVRVLEPGKPIEREIASGQQHSYQIALTSSQFLHVVVNQQGVDVFLLLWGPDGKLVAGMNSPNGTQGSETLYAIAEAAGTYRLDVAPVGTEKSSGRYKANIVELRQARAEDEAPVAAQRYLLEARVLEKENTKKSLLLAIDKYKEAQKLYEAFGDRGGAAKSVHLIGDVYLGFGDTQKMLDSYGLALSLYRAALDPSGEALVLWTLGRLYQSWSDQAGEYTNKALGYYNQALPLFRAFGDRRFAAVTLSSMGVLDVGLHKPMQGLNCFTEALSLFRALEDREWEADTLEHLAATYETLGGWQKALEYYLEALPLYQSLHNRKKEGAVIQEVGSIYRDRRPDEQQRALDYFNQALVIFQEVGDSKTAERLVSEIDHLKKIVATKEALKEWQALYAQETSATLTIDKQKKKELFEQAIKKMESALSSWGYADLERNEPDALGATVLDNIGMAYEAMGDKKKALAKYHRALMLFQEIGDPDGTEGRNIALEHIARIKSSDSNQASSISSQGQPELVIENGHSMPVLSVAFRPDGTIMASGSGDGTVKLWDVQRGLLLRTLVGHRGPVDSLKFSPDGETLVSGSNASKSADHTTKVWKVQSGKLTLNLATFETRSVTFSPDGQIIASYRTAEIDGQPDSIINLWNAQTGKLINKLDGNLGGVISLAFSPDGKTLASGGVDWSIKLWDVQGWKLIDSLQGHTSAITNVAFTSDSSVIISGSDDGATRLWDRQTGRLITSLTGRLICISAKGEMVAIQRDDKNLSLLEAKTGKLIHPLQEKYDPHIQRTFFSPDDKSIAITNRGGFDLWDVESGKVVLKRNERSFISFSPTGKMIAALSDDKEVEDGEHSGSVELWEARNGKLIGHLGIKWTNDPTDHIENLESSLMVFSPDEKTIATSWNEAIRVWDVESGKLNVEYKASSSTGGRISFDTDGRTLTWEDSRDTRLWDLQSGKLVRSARLDLAHKGLLSPDGKSELIASKRPKGIRLQDANSGRLIRFFAGDEDYANVEFSANGATFTLKKYDFRAATDAPSISIDLLNAQTGGLIRTLEGKVSAFSDDGKTLAVLGKKGISLWDVAGGRLIRGARIGDPKATPDFQEIEISPDLKRIAILAGGNRVGQYTLYDARTGETISDLSAGELIPPLSFSHDSKLIAVSSNNTAIDLWDSESGQLINTLEGHTSKILGLEFTADGKSLASSSADGTLKLWSVETGESLATLLILSDRDWLIVTPDGRFDTNNLEEIRGLHWTMPDEPLRPLPLEIFMRDYYEPRLLPRILNGEQFKPVRKLSELNRVQPEVKIASIERHKDQPDLVTVTVEVAKATGEFKQGNKKITHETGVYDLRLFRDGQIIAQRSDGPRQALPQSASDKENLLAWRNEAQVKLDANGKRTIKLENIKLPQSAGKHEVQFTAYAFNEDRVKSETAKTDRPFAYEVAKEKAIKGRAYIISVGVNAYENPAFDLRYSVNDAKAIQETMFDKLSKTGDYSEIVQVPLISDSKKAGDNRELTENTATKSNFKAVLDLLAGRAVDTERKKKIPNADNLRQARPEDLVLISFSSHGYADTNGNFFFVLYDTGPSTGEKVSEALLEKLSANFLSSEELSLWLRDVDAGEMLMIVDACHSAAAVAGKEFKPGPMGSRGLGQLSYDKGMRILTATQAADVAYGSGALKQGLLTYVLVKDGIEDGKADFKPKDRKITISEWLEYGEQGVPKLLEDAGTKARHADAPMELRDLVQKTASDVRTQRPSLFDFSRKRRDAVIVKQ